MKTLLKFLALAAVVGGYFYFTRPAEAPPHRYSADNVFYLRRYYSFRTTKGIVGFLPGQEVRLNAAFDPVPGRVMVTDGRYSAGVPRDLLTHDMDEADALSADDAQWQDVAAANVAENKRTADAASEVLDADMANGINSSNALMAQQNAVGTYHTRLNDGPTWAGVGGTGGSGYYSTGIRAGRASTGSSAASIAAFPANSGPQTISPSTASSTSSFHPPGLNYHGSLLDLDAQGLPR